MIELDAGLEEYIERHTEKEPDVLAQLSRATHQKMLRPRMLSGNMQGQLLKMLCRMNRVLRVLEIGTFTGYAAIAMAMGMEAGGVLHTIDINDELEDFTRAFIRRSGRGGNRRALPGRGRPGRDRAGRCLHGRGLQEAL